MPSQLCQGRVTGLALLLLVGSLMLAGCASTRTKLRVQTSPEQTTLRILDPSGKAVWEQKPGPAEVNVNPDYSSVSARRW